MSLKSAIISRRNSLLIVFLFSILLVLVCYAFVYPSLSVDESFVCVKTETELREAVNKAKMDVPVDIVLVGDISLDSELSIPAGADVTLKSASGEAGFFKLFGPKDLYVIFVEDGGRLTLDSVIVTHVDGAFGGGVCVERGGTFVMVNGEISGNRNMQGAGVLNFGTFELIGGLISGNKATYMGAGVCTHYKFVMSGGEISGNTVAGYGDQQSIGGGGVSVAMSVGIFSMSGGVITNNYSDNYGGGVYLSLSSTFNRAGGEISGNTSEVDSDIYQNNY